jgi:Ca2+-binding RTX toxin-like protein
VDNAADVVTEAAGAGNDTVLSSVTYGLSANVENLTLTGAANIDATGNGLSNGLTGNAGNNRLDGGAGADTMAGGAGDDGYVIDNAGDQVIELASQGFDKVSSSIDYVLPQNVEQLTLTGSALNATGNSLDNLLFGNDQANVLDGATGADQMAGGLGDDRYVVDSANDVVIEAANAGNDTVVSSVTYTLATNVENLILTGSAALNGTGNGGDNVLVGNTGSNSLSGGAGNDVLAGGQGNDLLDGGIGGDLYLYAQGDGRDVITDASGTDTIRFGAGITLDSVAARNVAVNGQTKTFISILKTEGTEQSDQGIELNASAPGIERFEFANGQVLTLADLMVTGRTLNGDYLANTLTGDRRDDTINAGAGNDIVYARTGNDIVYGGAGADKLFGEGGNDNLYGESEDDQLWGGAGNDMLDGSSGNDLLVGGTGNDQLFGGVDKDVLDGGDGNDLLDGSSGEDQLFAGTGDDILNGGTDADLLAAGDGNDVINAGSGQNVVVAGAGNDQIVTGTDGDFIDAGSGDDVITTDSSSDFIAGGKGNDTINSGTDRDLLAFNRGDGSDLVTGAGWDRDTLSLGGGIKYSDLSLRKSGNDLVLDVAQGDSITFRDWYTSSARRSVDLLQMVTVGGDYSASSTDRMKNRKVVTFDFEQLVNKFDQARTANPSLTSWPLDSQLNAYFKASSDTQALGGDLAYRYATTGSYGDLDWMGVRNRMTGMNGSTLQALTTSTAVNPWIALQAGLSLVADQTVGLPSPIAPVANQTPEELAFGALNATGHKPSWMGSQPGRILP